jgi:DHA1 family bicyclomycin/chloramphenicol resistance-like MFS transporter
VPATRTRRAGGLRLILILGALSAFGPLSTDMYLPALPRLARDFGARPSVIQLTLTTSVLGLALGQVLAGPISDALGRRPPLLVGLVAFIAASAGCALAPSVPVLIVLRLLQGLGGAAAIVIARAVVRDLYAGIEAARFFAVMMLVNGLAPILAPVIGGQIVRVASWRTIFVVLAAGCAVLLAATALGLRETLPPERRRSGGLRDSLATFRRLGRDRTFMGFVLALALSFSAMFAYIAGSPFVLQDLYGASPGQFGLVFAGNALGIVAAGQLSARLVGRVSSRRLLLAGLLLNVTGGVALLIAVLAGAGLPVVLAALFLVPASMGLILPNATALALNRHPEAAGTASAVIGVAQFAIAGALAPLVGIAGTGTAVPMAVVIAACGAAGLALAPRRV